MNKNQSKSRSQFSRESQESNAPRTAEELCQQLQQIIANESWSISTTKKFIQLLIDPNKQYQLNDKQKQSLITSVLDCPSEYISLIHLQILFRNSISHKKIYTLDGITTAIIDHIKKKLLLNSEIEASLLKNQDDKILVSWLDSKFSEYENLEEKIDFVRNLISYLIVKTESTESVVISSRLDLILKAFVAHPKTLEKYSKTKSTFQESVLDRLKAIVNLFTLNKISTNEVERLILFGSSAYEVANSQEIQIVHQNQSNHLKEEKIKILENQCKDLQDQVAQLVQQLQYYQETLDKEKAYYQELQASSQLKISQQRNRALTEVRGQIEHDLHKLERCFNGKIDSFPVNSEIGIEIINDIRSRLFE